MSHDGSLRRSSMLERLSVGIDIGGTKVAAGVVDETGHVLERMRRDTPTTSPAGVEDTIADIITELRPRHRVYSVGIGAAGFVDATRSSVLFAPHLAWRHEPLRDALRRRIGLSVTVENDANAAAWAEWRFGAARDEEDLVCITLGTGISSCLVQHGQPLAGARGNALVLASSPLASVCSVCGAVTATVLEAVATGPALVARYNARGSRPVTRAEEVLGAAAAGDKAAIDVAREGGEALGNSVAFLVNVLDPEALVVGGGLGQAEGIYWTSFVAALRAHIWADATRSLPVLRAALGGDAGFVGAAACAWLSGRRG